MESLLTNSIYENKYIFFWKWKFFMFITVATQTSNLLDLKFGVYKIYRLIYSILFSYLHIKPSKFPFYLEIMFSRNHLQILILD